MASISSDWNGDELEFSEDDKYVISAYRPTDQYFTMNQYFTIYSTDTWGLIYTRGWITSIVAHIIRNNMVFYGEINILLSMILNKKTLLVPLKMI